MWDGIGDGKDAGDAEHSADRRSALQLAIAAEADLRHLDSLLCVLSLLGERTDPIEPKVVAALAQATEPPLTRLISLHRAATQARSGFAPGRTAIDAPSVPAPTSEPVPAVITAPPCLSPTTAHPVSTSTALISDVFKGEP